MNAAENYFQIATDLLRQFRETQVSNIDAAAEICANSIANKGLVFVFGSGHSRFMCDEMTPRQGGLVGFVALVELAFSNHSAIVGSNGLRVPLYLEKYVGLGEEILKSFKFGRNDSFLLVSTSGIRPLIVDMAMGARERNLKVIALVSRQHSDKSTANHPSGKKLVDLADVVIDNQCPPGDCAQVIDGLEWPTGPASTLTGAMAVNMIRSA
ncbi:MAG TPA: sugar isomerase domain-containing protein, partial [Edaphobacter sp.]|nr:sugar isomerase domain-containing protein [Edaphobacter sp.]